MVVALGTIGLVNYREHQALTRLALPGDRFPSIPVATLDGKAETLQISDRGEYVINVFATWCGPCIEEMPEYNRTAAILATHGITTIGIAQGEQPQAVNAFQRQLKIGFALVTDPGSHTKRQLGARIIPETVIVRDGVIAREVSGPVNGAELTRLALAQ